VLLVHVLFFVCSRLRNRVLSVRNMFLQDRLAAMEHEMEAMSMRQRAAYSAPPRPSAPRRSPAPRYQQRQTTAAQSPLLKALLHSRAQ